MDEISLLFLKIIDESRHRITYLGYVLYSGQRIATPIDSLVYS